MGIWEWFNQNSNALLIIANIALVIVTLVYVILTKKILDSSRQQINFIHNPVLGIMLNKMQIDPDKGDRHRILNISIDIVNLGNAPSLEILIDSEIELKYSEIQGQRIIPSIYEPRLIPYLRVGENFSTDYRHNIYFGSTLNVNLISDFEKASRLNYERIHINPTRESYTSSILRIFVYYKNNLNQNFVSIYETLLDVDKIADDPIPYMVSGKSALPDDKAIILGEYPFKSPKFFAKPIQENTRNSEISSRNSKRKLGGF
jgi:hypothetical protein